MCSIRSARRAAAGVTLGLGVTVALWPAVAHADDHGSRSDHVVSPRTAGPAVHPKAARSVRQPTSDRRATRPTSTIRPAAVMATPALPSVTAAPSIAAARTALAPLDALTTALTAFNRELNRLFFNRTPTARPIQYPMDMPGVATGTIGASDPEDDPLSYTIITAPAHGTAIVDSAGSFTYTPIAEMAHTGMTDTFTVTVRDTGFHLNFWIPTTITVPVSVTIAPPITPPITPPTVPPTVPASTGPFTDLMTFGEFHGSSHTGMDALQGGRTAITTEAVLAYNALRRFSGLAPVTIDDVGRWAFANNLTNNAQAWNNDIPGVGLYYAMQGAKVGWIADDKYDPQIVAEIERTARLGSPADVMAMVYRYGHDGFARYLTDNGYETAFIDTLKMEPHYAGWMHDRANGRLVIEGSATAHDLNHLTVLSHDQTRPFMNDTWDWPQWPALEVSDSRVIEYFQSMVALGDPRGRNLDG